MIALLQRVEHARVVSGQEEVSSIGNGLLVFLGIGKGDTESDAEYLSKKICELRIFNDSDGKLNISVEDIEGELLVISQFTLLGDCRKGRRPSYSNALPPKEAVNLYEYFLQHLKNHGKKVTSGIFGAHMKVELVNDGPVTLIVKSKNHDK